MTQPSSAENRSVSSLQPMSGGMSAYNRSPQSSLDIVEPELVEALSRVSEQLDAIVEQSLNDEAPAQALAEKLSAQLDEVAGVFTMLNLPVATDLSSQLALAVNKVCQTQRPIEEREYQALFQCAYLLPRFFEYVQATGVTSPLLLAPSFYALASAGLAPFAAESELIEFDYQMSDQPAPQEAKTTKLSQGIELASAPESNASSFNDLTLELEIVPLESEQDKALELELEIDSVADIIDVESELAESSISNTGSNSVSDTSNATDPAQVKTFRRLRQMYQTGLIGMLRDDSVDAKLVLFERVAERCIALCNESGGSESTAAVWRLLKHYIDAVKHSKLELTPQRRHFFAKFDRSLKTLEKNPVEGFQTLPADSVLKELTLLLLLADPANANNIDIQLLGTFGPLHWSDAAVVEHREAMERSTHKALLSMLEVIKEELGGGKRILDMMSESGICENDDIDTLVANCQRISAVLKIGGFNTATSSIDESIGNIMLWRGASPDQEDLLEVANMMLYIENALLTGSLRNGVEDQDKNSTVAKGLLQQAQMDLYEESKANIGLAKRAVTSYIESNYDKEHIANVSVGLQSIAGAFNMVDINNAEQLMHRCAELIRVEYENQKSAGLDTSLEDESESSASANSVLENLADALVSVEYLLDELATGRGLEPGVSKLIDESYAALA